MIEQKNKKVKKALTILDQVSNDPKEQELFENRLMSEFRYHSGMHGAKEEGKKEEKMEIAKKLLDKGKSIDEICEITELSKEELEEIGSIK